MKFAFFGYDAMIHCADRLITDGYELAHVFSFPCDQVFSFHDKAHTLAQNQNAGFTITPPTTDEIARLMDDDVTVFIAAGYPFKIPPIDNTGAYGLNIHPSYLPKARGMMPTPYIFMHDPDAAGVSIHKITDRFDAGDIIIQERLPLTPQDTVETYTARIAITVPDMLSAICADIDQYWQNAKPQDNALATTAPMPDDAMRTLDWSDSVAANDQKSRAFGRVGVLATLNGTPITITAHKTWSHPHTLPPGTIAWQDTLSYVVALPDGFYMISENA